MSSSSNPGLYFVSVVVAIDSIGHSDGCRSCLAAVNIHSMQHPFQTSAIFEVSPTDLVLWDLEW